MHIMYTCHLCRRSVNELNPLINLADKVVMYSTCMYFHTRAHEGKSMQHAQVINPGKSFMYHASITCIDSSFPEIFQFYFITIKILQPSTSLPKYLELVVRGSQYFSGLFKEFCLHVQQFSE